MPKNKLDSNEKRYCYKRLLRRGGTRARLRPARRVLGFAPLIPCLRKGLIPFRLLYETRRNRLRVPIAPALLAGALIGPHSVAADAPLSPTAPHLSVDNPTATAGFYRLNWKSDAANFELQEASGPEFTAPRTLYQGADTASVISGKMDGTWHYRVRTVTHAGRGPWSDPVTVTVAHHPLSRALIFLSLGFVVFLAIAATVVRGKETE